MTENNFILTLLLSLVLTAATYMLFPIIFRLKNGRMKIKEARKICIINSIVVALLWAIYHSTQDMNINFAPALLWYFINCSILKEKEELYTETVLKNDKNSENQTTKEKIYVNITIEDVKTNNISFTPSQIFKNVISTASEYQKAIDVKSCIEASIEILKISHENQYMRMLLTLDETEIKEIVSNLNKKLK